MNILEQQKKAIKEDLQTLSNDTLLAAARGEFDIVKLMHAQLVSRGISPTALGWVGTRKAFDEFVERWEETPEY